MLEASEFDWGHGFVPRVGPANRLQVDRALSPPNLLGEPVELPWVIVDSHWALTNPHLLGHLRESGARLLFDAQAWRYREGPTFETPKFLQLPHSPKGPIEVPGTALRDFVKEEIAAQAGLQADAYLVPGFVPRDRNDDVRSLTLSAMDIAIEALSDVAPKPLVAFIGGHTRNIGAVEKLFTELHGAVAGVYLQLTPVNPKTDSPAKLVDIARLFLGCQEHDVKLLGGRMAAAGTLLRAVGVDAVDGGLAEGETFGLNGQLTSRKPASSDSKGTGRGPRIYIQQLGLSTNVADYQKLAAIPKVAVDLSPSAPCCRYRPLSEMGRHAGEHSLRCRVDEAIELARLPESMRAHRAIDVFRAKSSLLTTINGILRVEGLPPLPTRQIDNSVTALERLLDRPATG